MATHNDFGSLINMFSLETLAKSFSLLNKASKNLF